MKIIIAIIITLFIFAYIFIINFKKVKQITKDKSCDYITKKLPENKDICKSILKMLKNSNVEIEENSDSYTNLYIAVSKKIIIGKTAIDSVRVQTIAHECAHSVQNMKLQIANFVISNMYLIYFIVSIILTIFSIYEDVYFQVILLFLIGFTFFSIRAYLEVEAMTKAQFIAERYIKTTEIPQEEQEILIKHYEEINKTGIPLVIYTLLAKTIAKPLIYVIIVELFKVFV